MTATTLPDDIKLEVERCLFFFIRICVRRVISSGNTFQNTANAAAADLLGRIPASVPDDLRRRFRETLKFLRELIGSLDHRLDAASVRSFVQKSSEEAVCRLLHTTLLKSLA